MTVPALGHPAAEMGGKQEGEEEKTQKEEKAGKEREEEGEGEQGNQDLRLGHFTNNCNIFSVF